MQPDPQEELEALQIGGGFMNSLKILCSRVSYDDANKLILQEVLSAASMTPASTALGAHDVWLLWFMAFTSWVKKGALKHAEVW